MEIYRLRYDVGGTTGKTITFVADTSKTSLEKVLASRDRYFNENMNFCKITDIKILSRDQVSMGELSFGDFMRLFQNARGFSYE